ncbi:MAG: hypothetical protein J5737_01065 [Bacteroidales bacterium]|nr:hypothetical protein [Bacteroidales bacterium]
MKKWLMIVNPSSASSATAETWVESKRVLMAGGLDVDDVLTKYRGHAAELAREAAAGGCRNFIAVGGDGTIHEVMTGLLRYSDESGVSMGEFTLGVLPYGTGNDWIRTAGISADMNEAAAAIVRGRTGLEDVVRLTLPTGTFCMANIGGVGLDADVCVRTNALKAKGYRGGILYKLMTAVAIFAKKPGKVQIVCDGETVYEGKLFSAVIANGIYRGGGVAQNADGTGWDDGILDVSIMPGVGKLKAVLLMTHALTGDFAVQKGIITRRFRRMDVVPLGGVPDNVESDGEVPGQLPLTVELTGQQINIIVP